MLGKNEHVDDDECTSAEEDSEERPIVSLAAVAMVALVAMIWWLERRGAAI